MGSDMNELNNTYSSLKSVLGNQVEPLDSVQLVETYRGYFKPKKVKVILLAESHVFTTMEDQQIRIPNIQTLPNYPKQYAKFVYCLGYGERKLTNDLRHPKRDGTPQFWKILFSCNNKITENEDFAPVLGKTSTAQRIANKVKILNDLKEKGVWLVDTSIVALYKNGQKLTNMFQALEASWNQYTRNVVLSANPEHIVCIGKGVAGVVEKDLKKHFHNKYSIVDQPNAWFSSKKHMENYMHYSKICCREK